MPRILFSFFYLSRRKKKTKLAYNFHIQLYRSGTKWGDLLKNINEKKIFEIISRKNIAQQSLSPVPTFWTVENNINRLIFTCSKPNVLCIQNYERKEPSYFFYGMTFNMTYMI